MARVYLSKIESDSESDRLLRFERVLGVESKPAGSSRLLHHTVLLGKDQIVVFLLACPCESTEALSFFETIRSFPELNPPLVQAFDVVNIHR